jgi:hypothetical protein
MTKLAAKRQSQPLLVSRKWGYNIGIQINGREHVYGKSDRAAAS